MLHIPYKTFIHCPANITHTITTCSRNINVFQLNLAGPTLGSIVVTWTLQVKCGFSQTHYTLHTWGAITEWTKNETLEDTKVPYLAWTLWPKRKNWIGGSQGAPAVECGLNKRGIGIELGGPGENQQMVHCSSNNVIYRFWKITNHYLPKGGFYSTY